MSIEQAARESASISSPVAPKSPPRPVENDRLADAGNGVPHAAMGAKPASGSTGKKKKKRSDATRQALHLTRRGHLYGGLVLLPWVFLYGVTGLLFNHPTWFSDRMSLAFGAQEIQGTELESLQTPAAMAALVVSELNQDGGRYRLAETEAPKLGRGGLSATLSGADNKTYSLSIDSSGDGGTISESRRRGGGGGGGGREGGGRASTQRTPGTSQEGEGRGRRNRVDESQPASEAGDSESVSQDEEAGEERGERPRRSGRGGGGERGGDGEEAPSSARRMPRGEGRETASGERPERSGRRQNGEGEGRPERQGGVPRERNSAPFARQGGLMLPKSPVEMLRKSVPTLLERTGMKDVELQSVQMASLEFQMLDEENEVWNVTYDAESGSVAGVSEKARVAAASQGGNEMSLRRFLLRLHTSRGYPSDETNVRSVWAVFVDAVSLFMVFWGISGIIMWWQIKRTRTLGGICLGVSMLAAAWVGLEMHTMLISR